MDTLPVADVGLWWKNEERISIFKRDDIKVDGEMKSGFNQEKKKNMVSLRIRRERKRRNYRPKRKLKEKIEIEADRRSE